jgi:hypothetical protein
LGEKQEVQLPEAAVAKIQKHWQEAKSCQKLALLVASVRMGWEVQIRDPSSPSRQTGQHSIAQRDWMERYLVAQTRSWD